MGFVCLFVFSDSTGAFVIQRQKNTVGNVVELLKKASGWLHLVVGDDVATVHTSG